MKKNNATKTAIPLNALTGVKKNAIKENGARRIQTPHNITLNIVFAIFFTRPTQGRISNPPFLLMPGAQPEYSKHIKGARQAAPRVSFSD
ncbi:MAG: hypothetical protein WCX65_05290 [bacterium]